MRANRLQQFCEDLEHGRMTPDQVAKAKAAIAKAERDIELRKAVSRGR